TFGRDVVQVVWPAKRHRAGGDIDDATPPRATHRRHDGASTQKGTGDVDAQHLFPFLQRDLIERAHLQSREDGRVVDEYVDTTVVAIASTDLGSATSVSIASAWLPSAVISSATDWPRGWLRSAMMTMAPAKAKALAKMRPMPWPAPVMMARRPVREGNTTSR